MQFIKRIIFQVTGSRSAGWDVVMQWPKGEGSYAHFDRKWRAVYYCKALNSFTETIFFLRRSFL